MPRNNVPLRKAGRQNKRELLLNAAIEVFARKGEEIVNVNLACLRAGREFAQQNR